MPRYVIKVFYDGLGYHGYARQPGLRTVEGELVRALEEAGYIRCAREAKLQSSSRTDPDVIALDQLVAFNTEKRIIPMEINQYLPKEIVVWGWARVSDDFSLRRHVAARHYKYITVYYGEDVDAMEKVARMYEGTHDFRNLASESERPTVTTVYRIRVSVIKPLNMLAFDFIGKGFLNKQIRKMVWVMREVGAGRMSIEEARKLLDPSYRPRKGVGTVPARGLVLVRTILRERVRFCYDREALKLLRRLFMKSVVWNLSTYGVYMLLLGAFTMTDSLT